MDKHEIEADRHHDRMTEQADIKQAQYEVAALGQLSDIDAVIAALESYVVEGDLNHFIGEIAVMIANRPYMAEPKTALEKAIFEKLEEINEYQD